jgi:hypothetical protein
MKKGKIIISCGCEYTGDMQDLDKLLRVWTDEVCTRDPDNPFVMATVSGHYCDECWNSMNEVKDD